MSLQCINSCIRTAKKDLAELPKCTSTKMQADNSLSYRRESQRQKKSKSLIFTLIGSEFGFQNIHLHASVKEQ